MSTADNQRDMTGQQLSPTPEQIALLSAYPDSTPFVMVNLLKFKGQVGTQRYWREYARRVTEILASAGGQVLFNGHAEHLIIGAAPHNWDGIWLVRWPSKKAFCDMMNHPDFPATQEIRVSSLEAMALILTSELPEH